jgi:SIR2-like protein
VTKEEIAKLAQACFQACPAIILGSGASNPYGLPSMAALSKYLGDNLQIKGGVETKAWAQVRAALDDGDHLEAALEGKTLPSSLLRKIVRCTWRCVNEKDQKVVASIVDNDQTFPLGKILKGLFSSTHKEVHIVTTNYDRVAEYACNSVDFLFQTGFAPGYIQKWESSKRVTFRYRDKPSRVVKIWKVHGSLDWFQTKGERIIGLPVFSLPSADIIPLIVTPGLNKYEKTSEDPFRTTINGADIALKNASAFLCVGFGFRDKHIHPKIFERCREQNVPIVVLARTLTVEAKLFLKERAGANYLGIEKCGDGSRIFTSAEPDGFELEDCELWSFPNFNNLVL